MACANALLAQVERKSGSQPPAGKARHNVPPPPNASLRQQVNPPPQPLQPRAQRGMPVLFYKKGG
eukprot:11006501-Lingulodinium_polyedra.AAC.1